MIGNKGGRPSLPDTIKKLSGTIRKDRMKEGVEFDLITEVPKPATWLDGKAKIYFTNFCELFISKQLLNQGNVQLVLMMAKEYSIYEMACGELKTKKKYVVDNKKTGVCHQSPYVGIRNDALKNYRNIACLFGLDPVSAGKIGGPKKAEKDEFAETQKKYSD